jgi:hypothetical protein
MRRRRHLFGIVSPAADTHADTDADADADADSDDFRVPGGGAICVSWCVGEWTCLDRRRRDSCRARLDG